MSIKTKVIILTLILGIITFITGRQIWPPDPMGPMPTSAQLPFLIILGLFESVAFGLGASFLVFGWPLVQKVSGKGDNLTKLAFLSIVWYLINWWPHDHLHMQNGMNLDGIIKIEYCFHVTMIIAGAILAYFFSTRILKQKI